MKREQKDPGSHLDRRSLNSLPWVPPEVSVDEERPLLAPDGQVLWVSGSLSRVKPLRPGAFCHCCTASPNLTAYDLSKEPWFSYDHYNFCHIWKPPILLLNIFPTSTHLFSFGFILGSVLTTKWNTSIVSRKQWENKRNEINHYSIILLPFEDSGPFRPSSVLSALKKKKKKGGP